MHAIDLILCLIYLLVIAWVGLRASRRRVAATDAADRAADFHLAGRSASGLVVGLSVMVTAFSAVNFVLFPTEVAGHGLYVAASLPVFLLVAGPVMYWILPFYRRQASASAYAWLEERHGRRVRLLASGLFLVWRILWMALMLLAAARFMGRMTGWNVTALIVFCAAAAAAYTARGGLRAVLWTDAAQFVVLAGAIGAATVATVRRAGGLVGVWNAARDAGGLVPFIPFDPAFLSWDPRIRITLSSALIGTAVAFFARYVADQSIVQRYVAARSLAAARRGFVWNVAAALLAIGALLVLGVAVRANAALFPELGRLPPGAQLAALMRMLPVGGLGLVMAGLLAATMSSLDSGLHSCTTSLATDWRGVRVVARLLPPGMEHRSVILFGSFSAVLAISAQGLGDLFALANRIVNGMGSPLLALVLMAMIPRGVTRGGLFWGVLVGAVASVVLTLCVKPLAIHHYATINFAATVGLIAILSTCSAVMRQRRQAPEFSIQKLKTKGL